MASPSSPLEHLHSFVDRGLNPGSDNTLLAYLNVLWHTDRVNGGGGWRGATLDDMQRITPWLKQGNPNTLAEIWRMLVDTTKTETRAKETGAIAHFMKNASWPQDYGMLEKTWTDLFDLSEGKRGHSQQVDRIRFGWGFCVDCFERKGFPVPTSLAEKVANIAIAFSICDQGYQQQLREALKNAVVIAGIDQPWALKWARTALDDTYNEGARDTLVALLEVGVNIQQAHVSGGWTPMKLVAQELSHDDQPQPRARLVDLLELGADWSCLPKNREFARAWEYAQQNPVVRRALLGEAVEGQTQARQGKARSKM